MRYRIQCETDMKLERKIKRRIEMRLSSKISYQKEKKNKKVCGRILKWIFKELLKKKISLFSEFENVFFIFNKRFSGAFRIIEESFHVTLFKSW